MQFGMLSICLSYKLSDAMQCTIMLTHTKNVTHIKDKTNSYSFNTRDAHTEETQAEEGSRPTLLER